MASKIEPRVNGRRPSVVPDTTGIPERRERAMTEKGQASRLLAFWKNGNVPQSLQRWELLGLRDNVDSIDQPRGIGARCAP